MVGATEPVRQPAPVPLRLATTGLRRERGDVIALADRPGVLAAIDRARSVVLASYILPASVARRLAAAAARGARVDLSLAGPPIGATGRERAKLPRLNRAAVESVRRAGGSARLLPPADPLHLKAALVDDRIAYLDD